MAGRHRLGDVRRLEHDLCVRDERRRLGVPRAAEAEHRRRARRATRRDTETARRRCRRRRAAGSSTRRKPFPSGPSTRDLVAGPRGAERARARADRVDQEAELALRREAERHRPRQQPSGRLEHEELTRGCPARSAPRSSRSSVYGPTGSAAEDVKPSALQPRSAPGARRRPRCARSRSRGRPRPRRTAS